MKKCIVREGKEFVVKQYEDSEKFPANLAVKPQQRNTGGTSFIIAENDINVYWTNGTYQGHYVSFSLNGQELKRITPNIQSVCDYMNMYAKLTKSELNNLLIEAQKSKKSKLEEDIVLLEDKIKNQSFKLNTIIRIIQKKDEILKLINELND